VAITAGSENLTSIVNVLCWDTDTNGGDSGSGEQGRQRGERGPGSREGAAHGVLPPEGVHRVQGMASHRPHNVGGPFHPLATYRDGGVFTSRPDSGTPILPRVYGRRWPKATHPLGVETWRNDRRVRPGSWMAYVRQSGAMEARWPPSGRTTLRP
jgi:hypothetical protein